MPRKAKAKVKAPTKAPRRSPRAGARPTGRAKGAARTRGRSAARRRVQASGAVGQGTSPSALIDARIEELGDWRGESLARIRALIREAVPEVAEEWKWRGVPVWSHRGPICTGETYKAAVKLTFFKGASLEDPSGLFNASLEGSTRRAIDLHEGDALDEQAFRALVRAAMERNRRPD